MLNTRRPLFYSFVNDQLWIKRKRTVAEVKVEALPKKQVMIGAEPIYLAHHQKATGKQVETNARNGTIRMGARTRTLPKKEQTAFN